MATVPFLPVAGQALGKATLPLPRPTRLCLRLRFGMMLRVQFGEGDIGSSGGPVTERLLRVEGEGIMAGHDQAESYRASATARKKRLLGEFRCRWGMSSSCQAGHWHSRQTGHGGVDTCTERYKRTATCSR